MHQILFKNRFSALVFVAIILFSVRILVGTPDDSGALEEATARFGKEQPKPEAAATGGEQIAPQSPEAPEFTSEEELIDEAAGDEAEGFSADPGADEGGETSGPSSKIEFIDAGE